MVMLYRLTYESSPGNLTVWEKTAEELLVPNGATDSLLDWMLRESDARGNRVFTLECIGDA